MSAVSYYKRYALGTLLFKDCACTCEPAVSQYVVRSFFFFYFAGLYPERRKLSVGETRARSQILPTGFHLFLEGVSLLRICLYTFIFKIFFFLFGCTSQRWKMRCPARLPSFIFVSVFLRLSIIFSFFISSWASALCSATLIHTPKKHIDENRDGMSAAARLPAFPPVAFGSGKQIQEDERNRNRRNAYIAGILASSIAQTWRDESLFLFCFFFCWEEYCSSL